MKELYFNNADQWRNWLSKHHLQKESIWLIFYKKSVGKPTMNYESAVEEALCYGWIDSQRKGYDHDYFLQRYSPRTAKSPWSKLNVERAEALLANGRMQPAGLREIEAAKLDGRWAVAYEAQRNFIIPDDFETALTQNEPARHAFNQLNKSEQYAIILPILKATTAARRVDRLQKAIANLLKSD